MEAVVIRDVGVGTLVGLVFGLTAGGCGWSERGPAPAQPVAVAPAPAEAGPKAGEVVEVKPGPRGSSDLPFVVPAGYVAERIAGPPLLKHPMFAAFDDQGRLYVAGSSGRDLSAD